MNDLFDEIDEKEPGAEKEFGKGEASKVPSWMDQPVPDLWHHVDEACGEENAAAEAE